MANEMEAMIRKILADMQQGNTSMASSANSAPAFTGATATVADYPIAQKHPEWIDIGNGRDLSHVTMDAIMDGSITMKNLRINPEILKRQGQIAKAGGRDQIELNFARAAEMTKVDDKRLLEKYNALRPYRSSKQELLDIASELDQTGCPICANFVREAANNYEKRKKLKGDN